jgi:hypothetical protein
VGVLDEQFVMLGRRKKGEREKAKKEVKRGMGEKQ